MDVYLALTDAAQKYWGGFCAFFASEPNRFAFAAIAVLFLLGIARSGWGKSLSRLALSGSWASVLIMLTSIFFIPFVFLAVGWLQSSYAALGLPHVSQSFWSGLPFWVAGIIAIVCHDFADYCTHRIMHTQALWPIHAMHHSDKHVNGLTTFRIHFLEAILMKGSYVVLFSWAGFSPEALTFGAALLLVHNVYVHADLDWDHGPFKYLIASPRFHRFHHADDKRAYGKNLANIIPAYDWLFGTYYDPGTYTGPMGAKGVPHSDVMALHAYPFVQWSRAIKRRFSAGK